MFEDSMIESQKRFKSGRLKSRHAAFVCLASRFDRTAHPDPADCDPGHPHPAADDAVGGAPPPPPPPPPPPSAGRAPTATHTSAVKPLEPDQIRVPSKIPQKMRWRRLTLDHPPAAATALLAECRRRGRGDGGASGGVMGAVPTATPTMAVQKVRVSQGVAEGLLVHKVIPQYPALAREARIQGSVVLQASIGKNGNVENVQVLSGPPQLAQAAVEAVKQWRYKPYYLNGQPVEVQTTINVNFNRSSHS